MRKMVLVAAALVLALSAGCANHIRHADAVIWDRVPETDRVSLDDQKVKGAMVTAKVRFLCQKQQYSITNDIHTPYVAKAELYEVPVGLVAIVPSFAWWIVSKVATLGAAERKGAAAPLDWSAAGLNPLLNVENGMFKERYEVREKKGSRREQEGSKPEPYDAVVPPMEGKVEARFEGGEKVTVRVGEEVLLTINLVEVAQVMPSADAQKIEIEVKLQWNPQAEPVVKTVNVFIDNALAARLFALKDASRTLMATTDLAVFNTALDAVVKAGFSQEAAIIKDKRKGELVEPKPKMRDEG